MRLLQMSSRVSCIDLGVVPGAGSQRLSTLEPVILGIER